MRNLKQGFCPANAISLLPFKFTLLLFFISYLTSGFAQGGSGAASRKDSTTISGFTIVPDTSIAVSGTAFTDTLPGKGGLSGKKAKIKPPKKTDTTHYSPKIAAIRAAACPGLGQIYNKKYWKLPIVYGVLGTVTYFVAANSKRLKQFNGYIRNYYDTIPNPSPYDQLDISELETYQNTYRRNVQIAAFGTIFAWGLSIVDAVVDAHLRSFDVSDNLSLKIKPQINTLDNSYYTGIALNLTFK